MQKLAQLGLRPSRLLTFFSMNCTTVTVYVRQQPGFCCPDNFTFFLQFTETAENLPLCAPLHHSEQKAHLLSDVFPLPPLYFNPNRNNCHEELHLRFQYCIGLFCALVDICRFTEIVKFRFVRKS